MPFVLSRYIRFWYSRSISCHPCFLDDVIPTGQWLTTRAFLWSVCLCFIYSLSRTYPRILDHITTEFSFFVASSAHRGYKKILRVTLSWIISAYNLRSGYNQEIFTSLKNHINYMPTFYYPHLPRLSILFNWTKL